MAVLLPSVYFSDALCAIYHRCAEPEYRPAGTGTQIEVEVLLDLSNTTEKLGAYEARLNWNTAVLDLVEVTNGETPEFFDPQTRRNSGELVFSQFNISGAGGEVSLIKVRFDVVGLPPETTRLDLSISVLDAAQTFVSLLPQLEVESVSIQVMQDDTEPLTARLAVVPEEPSTGAQVEVEVLVDLSDQTDLLGAYEAHLVWDVSVLEMVELLDGETVAFAGPQSRSEPGELVFSNFNTRGTGGQVSLAKILFEVVGSPEQSSSLDLDFEVLDAAGTFVSLLPRLRIEPAEIQVASDTINPCDFDGDGFVGFSDFFLFADHFGASIDDERYDSIFDKDRDGVIGFTDFFVFSDNFGIDTRSN